jgi:2-oxoglutarate ferredoxin oxidoreductase subunit delta
VTLINIERCKGCSFCVEFCPSHNLSLSKKFNAKGYHYPEVHEQGLCKGCDLCGMLCPDFAIHGTRR